MKKENKIVTAAEIKKYATPEIYETVLNSVDTITASRASTFEEFDNNEDTAVSLFGFFDD